jgi:hypothetical protein
MQVYANGHDYLAKKLDEQGVKGCGLSPAHDPAAFSPIPTETGSG